jgi:hypothetical protein
MRRGGTSHDERKFAALPPSLSPSFPPPLPSRPSPYQVQQLHACLHLFAGVTAGLVGPTRGLPPGGEVVQPLLHEGEGGEQEKAGGREGREKAKREMQKRIDFFESRSRPPLLSSLPPFLPPSLPPFLPPYLPRSTSSCAVP